jgi:hypothetical protein
VHSIMASPFSSLRVQLIVLKVTPVGKHIILKVQYGTDKDTDKLQNGLPEVQCLERGRKIFLFSNGTVIRWILLFSPSHEC